MKKEKQLLFSVTIKDCKVDTFTAGGPGGQNQNRSQTAVRVTHTASGAVGESREFKSQLQNKRAAFARMAETKKFKSWAKQQSSKIKKEPTVEEVVAHWLQPKFLRVESHTEDGWLPYDETNS
jgi:protein subunit release factor B